MNILRYVFFLVSILVIIVGTINVKMLYKMRKSIDYKRTKVYEKFNVIALCGSTQFKEEFEMVQKELTLRGHIVLSLGCFEHSENGTYNEYQKKQLEKQHMARIDLASSVMVINKDGYIGESTKKEIEYAKDTNKSVFYWYN